MLPAALLLAVAAHAQQPPPTIRVPVPLVTIPALVFSKDNRLLPDLSAPSFRVLDNGRPQSVTVDESAGPFSIAVVVQTNQDVRDYVPFIAKTGSVLEALITGDFAAFAYADEVSVLKPFDKGDLAAALRTVSAKGRDARMIDAGLRAAALLATRPPTHTRVLLFLGQPLDRGSEATLGTLTEAVERNNIGVFALTLPLAGKSFVSDTFSLQGVSKAERGGYRASTDFKNLVRILSASAAHAADADPIQTLTAATGGTHLAVRTQRQLEDAIGALGFQLHSAYTIGYRPDSDAPGYHTVAVEVDVPGAKVYARPGYWRDAN